MVKLASRLLQGLGIGILLVALVAGCGPLRAGEPPTDDVVRGEATVEEVDLQIMESFPVQVAAIARGNLSDGCTEIDEVRSSFDEESETFTVTITTVRDEDAVCTQALVPFEERIELDVRGLPAGTYTVDVNGVRETFTLDVDNELPESSGAEIAWDEARELILAGRVEQVTQLHSLEVTLALEDGRRLVTREPAIDDVLDVVDACGEPCADMILATE
jgi:inhibitor of cysteine peptidase